METEVLSESKPIEAKTMVPSKMEKTMLQREDAKNVMKSFQDNLFGSSDSPRDIVMDVGEEKGNQKSKYPIWEEVNVIGYDEFVDTSLVDSQCVFAPQAELLGPHTYGMV